MIEIREKRLGKTVRTYEKENFENLLNDRFKFKFSDDGIEIFESTLEDVGILSKRTPGIFDLGESIFDDEKNVTNEVFNKAAFSSLSVKQRSHLFNIAYKEFRENFKDKPFVNFINTCLSEKDFSLWSISYVKKHQKSKEYDEFFEKVKKRIEFQNDMIATKLIDKNTLLVSVGQFIEIVSEKDRAIRKTIAMGFTQQRNLETFIDYNYLDDTDFDRFSYYYIIRLLNYYKKQDDLSEIDMESIPYPT